MVLQLSSQQQALDQFLTYPSEIRDDLRTLIVGVDYAARRDAFVADYEETGVPGAPWPGIQLGEVVDLTPSRVSVEIRLGATAFFVDAANAERAPGGPNQIRHLAGATVFAGPSRSVIIPYDVKPYDLIKLDDGLGQVLYTRVQYLEWVGGVPVVIVLTDNVPVGMAAGFGITIARAVSRVLDESDYALAADELSIEADIEFPIADGGPTYPVLGWPTGYSQVLVSYRAARDTNLGGVITAASQAQLMALFIGSEYPESGLGFAARRALFEAATTVPVMLVAVADESTDAWQEQLDRMRTDTRWFAMAPVTSDPDIQQLVVDLIQARRTAEYPSEAFISLPLIPSFSRWEDSEVVVVDDSLTPGELRTVTSSGLFSTTTAGNRLIIDEVSYTVALVISSQTVTVAAVVSPGALELTAIMADRTLEQQVVDLGNRASAFDEPGVSVVFPPSPYFAGELVEPHHLCAAIAGLRGITVGQRSLSNIALDFRWSTPQSLWEFSGLAKLLRDLGVFVVSQREGTACFVLYDSTTNQLSYQTGFESMVANIAIIERQLKLLVLNYEGAFKATQTVFDRLRNQAVQLGEYLKTNTVIQPYGALLLGLAVGAVTAVDPDDEPGRIVLPVRLTVAATVRSITVASEVTIATVDEEPEDG